MFFFDQMMVALYDYNPEVQSPQDNPDSELSFKKGQILTVVGEMVRRSGYSQVHFFVKLNRVTSVWETNEYLLNYYRKWR